MPPPMGSSEERASLHAIDGEQAITVLPVVYTLRTSGGDVPLEHSLKIGTEIPVTRGIDGDFIETVERVYEVRTREYQRRGEPAWIKRVHLTRPVSR